MTTATETKLDTIKNQLASAVGKLQTSEDWKALLRNVARANTLGVGRLSFRNQLLVMCQLGLPCQVATYKTWLSKGRQVRKGEHAAYILAPIIVKHDKRSGKVHDKPVCVGMKGMAVFGVEQTDGDALPTLPSIVSPVDSDEAFAGPVEALTAVALTIESVAVVEVRERVQGEPTANGWYSPSRQSIFVNATLPRAHQFKTLVHEVAHALLHGAEDHHSKPEREVEAESVAFVVSEALGLDTSGYSLPYVASWAQGEDAEAMVLASGERIVKASRRILEALLPKAEAGEVVEDAAA